MTDLIRLMIVDDQKRICQGREPYWNSKAASRW
jgi:hypothetical protein